MAFRDDRDAQLARAAALERENRRLEEELARHKAEAAAAASAEAAAEARDREAAAARRQAELAKENADLRAELARARGPGALRRAGAWIAGLRLAEPSGDGGYWRSALETWRIYAPITAALLVAAPLLGTRALVIALLCPVAAAALAAILLAVSWQLRRRRRAIAGGLAGFALSAAITVAFYDLIGNAEVEISKVMGVSMIMTIVALVGLLATRAIRWTSDLVPLVIFSPVLTLMPPAHLLICYALVVAGATVAEPPPRPRAPS